MKTQMPKWLVEYKKKTAFINILADAFDPNVSDAEIRERLKKLANEMEVSVPSTPSLTPRRRKRS